MEEIPPAEQEIVRLVQRLHETGNLHPLIEMLRRGEVGPERAREALRALADYDVDFLVQVALDALISEYLEDPGLAHQPARAVRGGDQPTQ